MCHQVAGGLGKQYLPTVPGAHDAGSTMHIQANIALGGELRLTSVQPYTYTHCCTLRPGMAGKSALSIGCCGDSISSAGEDDEEGVTLGVDLLPEIHAERHTQELAALREQVWVGNTQLLEQVCGSLDIREEQCDCSGRQVTHIKTPLCPSITTLTRQPLQREMATPLASSQSEPEPHHPIYQSRLIGITDMHWMQTDLFYELLNDRARFPFRAAVEEVCLYTIIEWVSEVLPAVDIEGSINVGMRCVGLKGCHAIHWTTAQLIRRIDDNFVVKLGSMRDNRLLYNRAWNGKEHHIGTLQGLSQ